MGFDPRFMALAERLSEYQTGQTASNPAVGCVLVENGAVVGRGATARGGRPHAETMAIEEAGSKARGSTAYVTLEPCAHFGHTPPCVDALIQAGVAELVCPWRDPNPVVDGRGFEKLEEAGIGVHKMRGELTDGLRYFFTNQVLSRPFIAIKLATSLDGKIALENGESQWISNAQARRYTRFLRSRFEGIVVGSGTVLADDPQLTTRIEGLSNPRPVIFDQRGRVPPAARVLDQKGALLIGQAGLEHSNSARFSTDARDLPEVMKVLLDQGIHSLLVEGGAELSASFIRAGLVDRIYHVTTGALMGADARSALGALKIDKMEKVLRPKLSKCHEFQGDFVLQYDFHHLDEEALRA